MIPLQNFTSALKLRKISDEEIHGWTQADQCSVVMPKTLGDIADSTNQTEQDKNNSIFLKAPIIFNETESIAISKYENEQQLKMAEEKFKEIMGGMMPFMTAPPEVNNGDVCWSVQK